jgi:hypothetical protein
MEVIWKIIASMGGGSGNSVYCASRLNDNILSKLQVRGKQLLRWTCSQSKDHPDYCLLVRDIVELTDRHIEVAGSRFDRNVGTDLPNYTASYP